MNRSIAFCFAALSLATLAACAKSPSGDAPIIPPTELAAVRTPPPDYPAELACTGVGGTTRLRIAIGPGTKPTDIELLASSGNAVLDENAIKAVQGWEFKPATRGGQPVTQKIQVPVNFKPPVERPAECFQYDEKH